MLRTLGKYIRQSTASILIETGIAINRKALFYKYDQTELDKFSRHKTLFPIHYTNTVLN